MANASGSTAWCPTISASQPPVSLWKWPRWFADTAKRERASIQSARRPLVWLRVSSPSGMMMAPKATVRMVKASAEGRWLPSARVRNCSTVAARLQA